MSKSISVLRVKGKGADAVDKVPRLLSVPGRAKMLAFPQSLYLTPVGGGQQWSAGQGSAVVSRPEPGALPFN